jgi:hypothetical protein
MPERSSLARPERVKAQIKAFAVDHRPSVTAPKAVVDIIGDAIGFVTGN